MGLSDVGLETEDGVDELGLRALLREEGDRSDGDCDLDLTGDMWRGAMDRMSGSDVPVNN